MNRLSWFSLRMRAWPQVIAGILLGLTGSAVLLATVDLRPAPPRVPQAAVLSDCDGTLGELVIHYVAGAGDIVGQAYCDFLRHLPGDVVVHVVCRDSRSFDELVQRVGSTRCQLHPAIVGHEITTWSRDRWLALQREDGAGTILLCPGEEKGQEIWPQRFGDTRVGGDLQRVLQPHVTCRRSRLFFDGGDFVADEYCVFVTPDVLLRNVQQTVTDRQELLTYLQDVLHRQVVLLRNAPPHHAGMFMMTVGDRTVLVGDPLLAQRILAEAAVEDADLQDFCPPSGADFSAETVARFDAVADQCRQAGYRVVRIPVVPGRDARTYLTYVNVILDQRDDARVVYMPVFDAVPVLNRAAANVWSQLGYEVRAVNCTDCSPHFGSLRCLVNVVRRT